MFKIDSPLANFLNRLVDIMILNILFIIACIPVITVGAALTAVYYMNFKMVKNEETYIIKGFLKAFRENFKQASVLWLFVFVLFVVIAADLWIILYPSMAFKLWAKVAVLAAAIFAMIGTVFIFPVQARFQNTVKNTIKNAFIMAVLNLPAAFILVLVCAVPCIILYLTPQFLPLIILMGFGVVFYIQSCVALYVFKKYEPEEIVENIEKAD